MTDTAPGLLTPALCELADLQYGMLTGDQAAASGDPGLPAALVEAGLAETVTDTVVRLRAGAHHPHPRIYAAWLGIESTTPPPSRDLAATGIASHATALVLYDLVPPYSPVPEFTAYLSSINRDELLEDLGLEPGRTPADLTPDRLIRWTPHAPEWQTVADLPTTTPAQTLFDLADRLEADQLHQLTRGFADRHHIDPYELRNDLEALVKRRDAERADAQSWADECRLTEPDWEPWIESSRTEQWVSRVIGDLVPF